MIVDVHTHTWDHQAHFTDEFRRQARSAPGGAEVNLAVSFDAYVASAPVDKTLISIVFGGKAKLSGQWVDDAYVAEYVAKHKHRMLGFLCVDPTQQGWQDELRCGHRELGMVGIKLLPMYAGFSPNDERLNPLWEYASDHALPVLLHTGTTFIRQAPLECTYPRHLDDVAIRFPDVKIVMAHLGHPFEAECIAVIRKHPNVYADISALHYRPFQFFHSLMLVQEYGVWHKLLFGTDFPFTTVNATIETLRSINEKMGGCNGMRLNEDAIESLICRDALALLGLPRPAAVATEPHT